MPENTQNIVLDYVLEKNLSVRAREKFVSHRAYETLEKIDLEEGILTHKELEKVLDSVEKNTTAK